MKALISSLIALFLCSVSLAQSNKEGKALFESECASCHTGDPESRAPAPDTLRELSAAAILDALSNGAMRVQGSRLSGLERHQIAEYISGNTLSGDSTGATTGRCESNPPFVFSAESGWNGWGAGERNERFQPKDTAGLDVKDISSLELKWAFGFPDATSAWAPASVAGGRVFVGSQNGTVYSLDMTTGCIYWHFSADGGVRTAMTFAPRGQGAAVYFGDTSANVYALDAHSGELLWKVKAESHPMARITGSIALFRDRLYVPMSSYEEAQMRVREYKCCTFRGSITAIDAKSGEVAWRRYVIPTEPKARAKRANGTTVWGPSGAAIWSPPTIDAKRNLLYVSTGNGYTGPPNDASDAVIAISLESGELVWTRQLHENDVYIGNCWSEFDEETKPECQERRGPDYDIGNPPILASLPDGTDRLIIGQKSGIGWALDPDKDGAIVWQYRAGKGGALGGMEWGSAVDSSHAYFPVSDIFSSSPGGLHAVDLKTGEARWVAPPATPKCPENSRRCNAAQAAAITVIEGAVLSGANDGVLRAYSTTDGSVLWQVDTNGEYETVNGVPAKGASMICPGPTVAGGMVFVSSGYGAFGGRPGNVLLAFGPGDEEK